MAATERPVSIRRRASSGGAPATGCFAPSLQLHFLPTGQVRVCCWSTKSVGDIRTQRLSEIWEGSARTALQQRLDGGDFGDGCAGCAAELEVEGRADSHPAYFDAWQRSVAGHPQVGRLPLRMEFEISITCNLQCVQCSGANSSSIRLHREKRPPLPQPYDDRFFDDLVPFLPHLVEASFVGGEPFLGPENFRIWESMIDHAPHVHCEICTNGTQWSDRILRVLEELHVDITVSLDGATAETYERVRPGASFERVMANLDRFCAVADRRGTRVRINHCLMPENAHEFGQMLLLAERRGIVVNAIVVRSPKEHSIVSWGPEQLRDLLATWEAEAEAIRPLLSLNRFAWDRELARLRSWIDSGSDAGHERLTSSVLMFPRQGPVAEPNLREREAVGANLAARAAEGVVHRMVFGTDDQIVEVPAAFAERIAVSPADLLGRPASALLDVLTRWDVVAEETGWVEVELAFHAGRALGIFVPVRDEHGWADRVELQVAFLDR